MQAVQTPETHSALAARNIVCWGSSGSGKSSLAVNLACELADMGQLVLLVDGDSYQPSLAAMLAINSPGPGITAALRLVRAGRFDFAELERLGHKIELNQKSLRLISGMNNPARWSELDSSALAAFTSQVAAWFDFVVWDIASHLESGVVGGELGAERNAASNTIIGLADSVLATFLADPVGINRFLFDIRCIGRDYIPIANRVRSSVLGRQPERQLRDALFQLARVKLNFEIPEDQGFDEMLKNVRPLMLQSNRSKARETIRQLAQELMDMQNG
jgi:MinD-like ATPase involved in chromosome partitioning or flagellar assembly